MKNKFVLYISYFFYLIILGQGCSGISSKPHLVSFKIPSITTPEIKELSEVRLTSSREKIPHKKLYRIEDKFNTHEDLFAENKDDRIETSVIKKEIKIQETVEVVLPKVTKLTHNKIKNDERVLSLRMHINHSGFKVKALKPISIAKAYNGYLIKISERLAAIDRATENQAKQEKHKEKSDQDLEKSVASYDPTNKEAIENFEKDKLSYIASAVEETKVSNTDDIVFMDYSKKKSERPVSKDNIIKNEQDNFDREKARLALAMASDDSLDKIANNDISHRVTNVIKREMGTAAVQTKAQNSYAQLLRHFNKRGAVSQIMAEPSSEEEGSKMVIHAFHTEFGKEIGNAVHNFAMYSSTDNNKVYEDYNEGKIQYEYSLNGYSGLLRATLVKNFYARTTIEVPLTGEYSNVEVPLIDMRSLENYMDKNGLSGYGGHYLVDLGDYFEDVEISSDQNREASYEQRVYLDENFKVIKSGKDYRYIFFIGVIPGNIRVEYLGANRSETSKITFVAPDEITFDLASAQPSHEVMFDLVLKNTLGVQNVPLDLDRKKLTTFIGQKNPMKISAGKYSLNIPWGLKGERTYIEVNHLSSPMFVGMDGNNKLELPSIEFVQEILKSFKIDELHSNECLMHLNLDAKEVVDIKVRGESALGPMTYEQSYLDKDGVFTRFVSPMSNKLFLLGNEEGIFTIQIKYADGKKDYLRTYCSPGTYLLEQL